MLEIASQITICLLLAALIGFIMGFIIGRGSRKKVETNSPETHPEEKTETTSKSVSIEDEVETPIASVQEEDDKAVEIPTASIIENASRALEEAESQEEGKKPELFSASEAKKKDALTKIKGIGPKVEEQLNQAGIYTFEQIANWSDENIKWLEKHTTFAHRAKKDLWVKQAQALI